MSENNGQERRPSLWLVLALPVSVAICVFALGFGILSATGIDEEGGGEATPTTTETQPSPSADGAEIWASQGCGGCHTLSATGDSGSVGPNLDETQLSTEEIAAIVATGRNQMPGFSASLSEEDIAAVAAFVSESATAAQSP